jgi:hypothetical protein
MAEGIPAPTKRKQVRGSVHESSEPKEATRNPLTRAVVKESSVPQKKAFPESKNDDIRWCIASSI